MSRSTRIVTGLASFAAAVAVSIALPAAASADDKTPPPPCEKGAYAWQDACVPTPGTRDGG